MCLHFKVKITGRRAKAESDDEEIEISDAELRDRRTRAGMLFDEPSSPVQGTDLDLRYSFIEML